LKKKQIKKKKSDDKQSALADLLRKHGAQIYDDIDKGNFPKFTIPSRSVSNIVYDKKIRQYILGANTAVRSSRNTSQLRSFTQLMWLAFFANRLTGQKNLLLFEMYITHLKLLQLILKISLNLIT